MVKELKCLMALAVSSLAEAAHFGVYSVNNVKTFSRSGSLRLVVDGDGLRRIVEAGTRSTPADV